MIEAQEQEKKKKRDNGNDNKPIDYSKLTEKEKRKKKALIRAAYNHGDLSMAEADVLLSRIDGKDALVDIMGYEATMAASDMMAAKRDMDRLNKNAGKRIAYSAGVGGGIGGIGGTVIGAATAYNNVTNEAAQITARYYDAEQRFTNANSKNSTYFYTGAKKDNNATGKNNNTIRTSKPAKKDNNISEVSNNTSKTSIPAKKEWVCKCGNINDDYVVICECGRKREELASNITNRTTEPVKKGWVCKCGNINDDYVVICDCGRTRGETE